MKNLKFLALAFIACMSVFTSCSDSNEESPAEPSIILSAEDATITSINGTASVTINANVPWKAESDQTWLTISPDHGEGNGTIVIAAEENTSYESRQATVTISMSEARAALMKKITVTQDGKDKPTYHFDVMASVGGTTGMGSSGVTSTLIRSLTLDEVENPEFTVSFKGTGVDIIQDVNSESIINKGYYYEVAPLGNSWIGKYIINDNKTVQTVAKFELGTKVFKTKQYTHAWTGENTLVILGADKSVSTRGGGANRTNKIMWARFKDNGTSFSLEAEGDLDLNTLTKAFKENGLTAFSTSGLATYRSSDNTIIYAFVDNDLDAKTLINGVFVAFIDASTMEVKKIIKDDRAETLAGTAYGELQQDKMFFDENGDLYIGAEKYIANDKNSTTPQYGRILRIKNSTTEFDASYLGFSQYEDGKILSMDYLGNGKAIFSMQDPVKAGITPSRDKYAGWTQNEVSVYYTVYDIATGKATDLTDIPFSSGSFGDRVAVAKDKCYIASSPDDKVSLPAIYIYDIKTGTLKKGAGIEAGFYINRLNVVDNLN